MKRNGENNFQSYISANINHHPETFETIHEQNHSVWEVDKLGIRINS